MRTKPKHDGEAAKMAGWEDTSSNGDELLAERIRRASKAVEIAGPSGLVAALFHVDTARPGHDEVSNSELLASLEKGFRFDRGLADQVFPESSRIRLAGELSAIKQADTITVIKLSSWEGSDITIDAGDGLVLDISRDVSCRPGRWGLEVAYFMSVSYSSSDETIPHRQPGVLEEVAFSVALASLALCDIDAVYDSLDTRMKGVSFAISTPSSSLCGSVLTAVLAGEAEKGHGPTRILEVFSRIEADAS